MVGSGAEVWQGGGSRRGKGVFSLKATLVIYCIPQKPGSSYNWTVCSILVVAYINRATTPTL